MGRTTTRIPMCHRVLSPNHNYNTCDDPRDQTPVQLCGSIFRFLQEEAIVLSSPEYDIYDIQHESEEEDDSENPEEVEEKIKFWETQHQNLHTTLFRTTSLESKIRNITKEVLEEVKMIDNACSCLKPVSGDCRGCQMREICIRLQNSGYNSAICRTKWKSSLDIPSGEHTFLDVIDGSNPRKGEVRVIIELELRGQFEMKKGSDEYSDLVRKLPEVFVGKFERLQTIIKILSIAAKRSMKEKKMHLGPWRKQQYMQAKWFRVIERDIVANVIKPLVLDGYSTRSTRVRESMLTIDLLDNLPNMSYFCPHTVEVL